MFKTKKRVEENEKRIYGEGGRYCSLPDLDIKEPELTFEFLGNGEKEAFHTIKWLEEGYTKIERDWSKFQKESRTRQEIKDLDNQGSKVTYKRRIGKRIVHEISRSHKV